MNLGEYLKTCPGRYPLIEANCKTMMSMDINIVVPLLKEAALTPVRGDGKSTMRTMFFDEIVDLFKTHDNKKF